MMLPCLYCEENTWLFCACGAHQCHQCARLDALCPICLRMEQAKQHVSLMKRIVFGHHFLVTLPQLRAIDTYATAKITAVLETVRKDKQC